MAYSKTVVVQIPDKEYTQKTGKVIEYGLDERLKYSTKTKIIDTLKNNDKDFLAIVDGEEGSGKSTFGLQWVKYVDPTFNIDRICFNAEEFRDAILKAKKGQAVVYDEAFTGLSSRNALGSVNKTLVSLGMQCRQKNLFIVLILPLVFLLDKYFVMSRAKCLVHVYENKGRRGYFRVYNKRKIKLLILKGKNTFSYSKEVKTNFKGHFYGKFALDPENLLGLETKYRKKKEKALMESEKNPMTASQAKYKSQRDVLIHLYRKFTKKTYQEIEEDLLDNDIDISYVQIRNICLKFGDFNKEEKELRLKERKEKIEERKNKS